MAFLAAAGLTILFRWLHSTVAHRWMTCWLHLASSFLILFIGYPFSDRFMPWLLILHILFIALSCLRLTEGCILHSKPEDLKLYRIRTTHYSLFALLTVLTILILLQRSGNVEPKYLLENAAVLRGVWIISYAAFSGGGLTRYQARWYLRRSNLLFIAALCLLAFLDVLLLSGIILQKPEEQTSNLFNLLMIAEPIAFSLLALAMHVLVVDGLVIHLEETLVQVSKNSAKLRILAERDPLTAVLNRHAFYSMVSAKRGQDQKQPLGGSVAIIDIDNLKPLNDQHGHQTGDAAIRAVAKAIRSVVRAEDLLFRWGGDEFLVILPHVDLEEARWRFQKLDDILRKTHLPGIKHNVPITLSIGV
ncbi:MAG TPA: GGDEF domain-containing protein, partial [Gemmatales bacterium]|nr:GGDEF domain-containing protein [Gemmatales bacterium]